MANTSKSDDMAARTVDIDSLSAPLSLPSTSRSKGDPNAFVRQVYAENIALGGVYQQDIIKQHPGAAPTGELQQAAQKVETQAVSAAGPNPPHFEPLSLDILPQKYWQPVFSGCQSTFTDERCNFSPPVPRIWVPNLNELRYARTLEQGRTNLIEPMEARQALAQLLMLGVRTRKDVYTQAGAANDIGAHSACAQLKRESPTHVWR